MLNASLIFAGAMARREARASRGKFALAAILLAAAAAMSFGVRSISDGFTSGCTPTLEGGLPPMRWWCISVLRQPLSSGLPYMPWRAKPRSRWLWRCRFWSPPMKHRTLCSWRPRLWILVSIHLRTGPRPDSIVAGKSGHRFSYGFTGPAGDIAGSGQWHDSN